MLSTCTREDILSMCISPLTQTMERVISAVQSCDHLHICNHVKAAHRLMWLCWFCASMPAQEAAAAALTVPAWWLVVVGSTVLQAYWCRTREIPHTELTKGRAVLLQAYAWRLTV